MIRDSENCKYDSDRKSRTAEDDTFSFLTFLRKVLKIVSAASARPS